MPSPVPLETYSRATHDRLPKASAHSLQFYESTGRSKPPAGDTQLSPDSNWSSVSSISTSSAPQLTQETMSASISTYSRDVQLVMPHLSSEKRYAVYLHYTKRATSGRDKSNEVMILAPEGSTWDSAYAAFSKFFGKKTGKSWEVTTGKTAKTSRISCNIPTPDTGDAPVSAGQDVNQAKSASPGLQVETGIGLIEREPFVYMPLSAKDLERFKKKYAKQYNEDWLLPSRPADPALGTTAVKEAAA